METADSPNHEMEALVNEAIVMAKSGTRSAAAEFLYKRRCSLDVIARVLAKSPDLTKIRPGPNAATDPNPSDRHPSGQHVPSDCKVPGHP